jgi:hypothetical protein
MANPEHRAKLKEGVEEWNRWREADPDVRPDLESANLSHANLSHANLSHANLSYANLGITNLCYADLSITNLSEAFLFGAFLREANLSLADLSDADLSGANLNKAHLYASKVQKAQLYHTVFGGCDLSKAEGLDLVQHDGPSTIGIDTIYRSQGKIPEIFLRGAGVPDNFIEYMHSLVGKAFEFYSCFISYSTKDQEFADRLYADLQAKGVRCWFAPHDVESGKKLHEQIDQAIRLHEKLLLILSPSSINSEWVKTEIKKARNREVKENRRVLFPIGLIPFEKLKNWEYPDPDTGKDIAIEIREYYIPDFTKWKDHSLYLDEFKKLLKSLKQKSDEPAPPAATKKAKGNP